MRRALALACLAFAARAAADAPKVPPHCQLIADWPFLIRGARAQIVPVRLGDVAATVRDLATQTRLFSVTSTAAFSMKDSCDSLPGTLFLRDPDNAKIVFSAELRNVDVKKRTGELSFAPVPGDLADGAQTWLIADAADAATTIGYLRLTAVAIPSPDKMEIQYDDGVLNTLHSGVASVGADSRPSIAVVNRLWEFYASGGRHCDGPGDPCRRGDLVNRVSFAELVKALPLQSSTGGEWVLAGSSWNDDVWFRGCDGPPGGACRLRDLEQVDFAVRKRNTLPLVVQLRYLHDGKPAFEVGVRLASESRVESIPLSIDRKVSILCREHGWAPVHNAEVRPVFDDVLFTGLCRILFHATDTAEGDPERDLQRVILAGPQTVDITVHRDGAGDDAVSRATADPLTTLRPSALKSAAAPPPFADLELPLPAKVAEGDGPVTVQVRIAASAPEATYRDGSQDQVKSKLTAELPSRRFKEYLRPRGPFGFPCCMRMFVTVPVQAIGVRLPASPRDLRTSTDSVNFELTTLRTGVLVGMEPWNYATGKNWLAVPLRVLSGFNFVTVGTSSTRFDPSFVLGIAATFPLIESDRKIASQIGTSLALSVSWEVSLRDGRSYAVIGLGLDFLTLFGAK